VVIVTVVAVTVVAVAMIAVAMIAVAMIAVAMIAVAMIAVAMMIAMAGRLIPSFPSFLFSLRPSSRLASAASPFGMMLAGPIATVLLPPIGVMPLVMLIIVTPAAVAASAKDRLAVLWMVAKKFRGIGVVSKPIGVASQIWIGLQFSSGVGMSFRECVPCVLVGQARELRPRRDGHRQPQDRDR
jgi:hypothetical protein